MMAIEWWVEWYTHLCIIIHIFDHLNDAWSNIWCINIWVTAHIWMSHGTHVRHHSFTCLILMNDVICTCDKNETCDVIRMRHVNEVHKNSYEFEFIRTLMNSYEWCEWMMAHTSHVSHMNDSYVSHDSFTAHIWTMHKYMNDSNTYMNDQIYEWFEWCMIVLLITH